MAQGVGLVPPAGRLRCRSCKVKCATSRYLNRDEGRPRRPPPSRPSTITVRTRWPVPFRGFETFAAAVRARQEIEVAARRMTVQSEQQTASY
jgi:hypothetical protein